MSSNIKDGYFIENVFARSSYRLDVHHPSLIRIHQNFLALHDAWTLTIDGDKFVQYKPATCLKKATAGDSVSVHYTASSCQSHFPLCSIGILIQAHIECDRSFKAVVKASR